MSGLGDSHYRGTAPGGSSGMGCALLTVAVAIVLTFVISTMDPTDGLDYASGDAPEEMKHTVCYSDSGPCPPTGFKWKIPASGAVRTTFRREEIDDHTDLRGWLELDATAFVRGEAQDCAAGVEWSLLANGKPIAHGTATAESDPAQVEGRPPRETRTLVFAARRTDSLTCPSTLQWTHAGLT